MYVPPVRVRTNYVGVLAFEKALGQLAPHEACFPWRDLAWLKRLAYVVGNHARSLAPRAQRVLPFRERELCCNDLRSAAIGIDQRAVFSFLRVLDVVRSLGERAYNRLTL